MFSESTLLVRPEHLNHHGFLFGGRLLEWLDEQAYIAAVSCVKPEANLVTIGIDRVAFKHAVRQGSLLRFRSLPVHVGHTSLTVFTQVFLLGSDELVDIFSAYVTFVCLDKKTKPRPIARLLRKPFTCDKLPSPEQRQHWHEVERARQNRKQHPRVFSS